MGDVGLSACGAGDGLPSRLAVGRTACVGSAACGVVFMSSVRRPRHQTRATTAANAPKTRYCVRRETDGFITGWQHILAIRRIEYTALLSLDGSTRSIT